MKREATPRSVCLRCRRPTSVCVCGLAPGLSTRTRVLLLQHPRESRMPVGTARLAHLGLSGSHLRVGLDFAEDPVVRAALAERPVPFVLFPGADAVDARTLPRVGPPHTVIVIDGTWTQAKKLLRLNPAVAALPRLSFPAGRLSAYLIRKQPADFCVSTIEALGQVLEVLEPDGFDSARLLEPFLAMVKRQHQFSQDVHASRHRHARGAVGAREPRELQALRVLFPRLVCVHGEVNAWPLAHPLWQPAEIVQWLAARPATGEFAETIVRPQRAHSPGLSRHIEIDEEVLMAGGTLAGLREGFASFCRPDDVLVCWGTFPRDLAVRDEVIAPQAPVIDLRTKSAQWLHRKAGPVDVITRQLGFAIGLALGQGRGGRRLAHLLALVRGVCSQTPALPR